ncbi:hypothetical protein DL95DRAFT_471796 [Leptodontidium sp. 2 PMI_412]|nr:hypothetical protein DL95DRAFT_471796 [Leptodontidium sp. 2 PMI_412]
MRRRQQPTPSSASDSDGSDIGSCFDTGDEQEGTDTETEPMDVDTDADGDDEADLPDLEWLAGEENTHPPGYYFDQENNSDESEDEDEDYSDGSLLLLDMIEGNFHRIATKNTFVLPEIIFDPSLILSPHVALLDLIFADNAFLAPSLTSAERISELDISPGYEQLPLHLKPKMANIPVFRKSIRTPYGWEISPD